MACQANRLTDAEVEACNRSQNPSQEETRLLTKKFKQLELRVGSSCAADVLNQLPDLLQNFDDAKATDLLKKVEKSCFKEKVKYFLFIVLGVIGLAASLCIILTTGPASPFLFAVGALLWFSVDSSKFHEYLGEKCWVWLGEKRPEPLQENRSLLGES